MTGARTVSAFACFWLALLLGASPGFAAAERLGRLFSTPEAREALNDLRNQYEYGKPAQPAAEQGPVIEHVTVNGFVIRSNGQNSSWVNGTSIPSGEATQEGIRVVPSGSSAVRIELPNDLNPIELKPGQKVDVIKGQVSDIYQNASDESAPSVFEEADPGGASGALN
jgi:hypothetical protein